MATGKSAKTVVVTSPLRCCFLTVFKTSEYLGAHSYGVDVLVSKDNPEPLRPINVAYRKVCQEAFGKPEAKNRPWSFNAKYKGDKAIVKDGDARYDRADPERKDTYAAFRDHYYMSIKLDPAEGKPIVRDRHGVPIDDESELMSGDYIQCQFSISAYTSKKYGEMVTTRLIGVKKIKTGEHFSEAIIDPAAAEAAFDAATFDESEWVDDDAENWSTNDDDII